MTYATSAAAMAADNYGREEWRVPTLESGDTLLADEPGRVLDNTCYRSHYFRLARAEFGGYFIIVKHGGGQERFKAAWSKRLAATLDTLDSDARYFMLHTLYRVYADARREGAACEAATYRAAFVDGRLKKRKQRGQDGYEVWIERGQS